MPALPWTTRGDIEPDRTYVAMASRLPLQRYRSTLRFLRYTLAIRRQLAAANGLVGYSLYAQLTRKTFWTFSGWADGDSLDAFGDVRSSPPDHPPARRPHGPHEIRVPVSQRR